MDHEYNTDQKELSSTEGEFKGQSESNFKFCSEESFLNLVGEDRCSVAHYGMVNVSIHQAV